MADGSTGKPLQSMSTHHHHDCRAAAGAQASGFMASMEARYQTPPCLSTEGVSLTAFCHLAITEIT